MRKKNLTIHMITYDHIYHKKNQIKIHQLIINDSPPFNYVQVAATLISGMSI